MQEHSVAKSRYLQAGLSFLLAVVGVLLFVRLAFAQPQQVNHDFVIQNIRIFDGSSVVPKLEPQTPRGSKRPWKQ